MRTPVAALAVLAVMLPGTPRAEELPWCVEVDVFTKNCAFAKHDECVEMAKNVASPATGAGRCIANPNYKPPQPGKGAAKTSATTSARTPRQSAPKPQ